MARPNKTVGQVENDRGQDLTQRVRRGKCMHSYLSVPEIWEECLKFRRNPLRDNLLIHVDQARNGTFSIEWFYETSDPVCPKAHPIDCVNGSCAGNWRPHEPSHRGRGLLRWHRDRLQ